MKLANLSRQGNEDVVLFLHGIGCVKENFAAFWDAPEFEGMALLAPDLPGHGESHDMPLEGSTIERMAVAVRDLLRDRAGEARHLHIVAHSMGGAVGLLLTEQTPIELASFINVEGNLVATDCGLLSRRTAEADPKLFRDEKFARMKARAREADDPVTRAWAEWVEPCPAEMFHNTARSLVDWSDGGRLLEIFRALPVPKAYVYGQHSANPDVLARLEGIPQHRIADCGHFVMFEKPSELAHIVREVISQPR